VTFQPLVAFRPPSSATCKGAPVRFEAFLWKTTVLGSGLAYRGAGAFLEIRNWLEAKCWPRRDANG